MTTIEVPAKDRVVNYISWTNQLPSELLAKIFILTEKMYRHARLTSDTYYGFQDTATQVCRHWRETAILTQELWTYIFISGPTPHEHARLYLSRSGTCLIHVDLVIRPLDTEGIGLRPLEVDHTIRLFDMILSVLYGGGYWDRWSSFSLLAGSSQAFFKAMKHINAKPTPNLKCVSLQYEQLSGALNEPQLPVEVDLSHTLEVGPHRPVLSSVQLCGLPLHFIVDRPKPLVSGLRRLALACGSTPHPIQSLGTLLGACTQLESLSLDMGPTKSVRLEDPPIADIRVFLPSLRFFSLDLIFSCAWGLHVLKIIDAPGVEIFQSVLEFSQHAAKAELVRFISSGRLNGALQEEPATGQPGAGPLFPSLRTLSLPNFPFYDTIHADLLNAYTEITRAALSTSGVGFLSYQDRFLPHLTHLRCPDYKDPANMAAIREAVQKRRDWGMQLSLLELVSTGSEPAGWKTPEDIEEDFGSALLDGLVVRQIMDWRFGWLGVYDIEDCNPT